MAVFGWVYLVFGFSLEVLPIVILSSDDDLWWGLPGASFITSCGFSTWLSYGPLYVKSPIPVALAYFAGCLGLLCLFWLQE